MTKAVKKINAGSRRKLTISLVLRVNFDPKLGATRGYHIIHDTEQDGLGLQITKADNKSYVFGYKMRGGRDSRSQRKTIGNVKSITLQQARDLAGEYSYLVKKGIDPFEVIEVPSLAEVSEDMIDYRAKGSGRDKKIAENTRKRWTEILNAHIKTHRIGRKPIDKITVFVAEEFYESKVTKTPVQANRILGFLKLVDKYAIRKGYKQPNDFVWQYIETYKENDPEIHTIRRPRFADDEEVQAMARYLDEAEQGIITDKRGHAINPVWIKATRALFVSGARPIEIATIEERNIKREKGIIECHKTKTGYKPIPLSSELLKIIDGTLALIADGIIKRADSNDYIFPRKDGTGHISLNGNICWLRMVETLGLKEATPYSCRRNFASQGLEAVENRNVGDVQKAMFHDKEASTLVYIGEDQQAVEEERKVVHFVTEKIARQLMKQSDYKK